MFGVLSPVNHQGYIRAECRHHTASLYRSSFSSAREPCKLYCLAETLNYIFTIKHVALDGTRCSESSGICIEGSCQVWFVCLSVSFFRLHLFLRPSSPFLLPLPPSSASFLFCLFFSISFCCCCSSFSSPSFLCLLVLFRLLLLFHLLRSCLQPVFFPDVILVSLLVFPIFSLLLHFRQSGLKCPSSYRH